MRKLLLLSLLLLLLPLHTEAQSRLFVRANGDKVIVAGNPGSYSGNYSYSCWLWFTSLPTVGAGAFQTIYNDGAGTNSQAIWIFYYNPAGTKQISLRTCTSFGGYIHRFYNYDFTAGVWAHLAITIDPTLADDVDAKVYVNGSQVTQTSNTGGDWSTNSSFHGTAGIGILREATDLHAFDGRIAQFIRVNRIFSDGEIAALARGADFTKMGPLSSYGFAYRMNGLFSQEDDLGPNRLHSTSISGTATATGPPTVAR